MSKLGNKIINIENNIFITLQINKIFIKGEFGEIEYSIPNCLEIKITNNALSILKKENDRNSRELQGLMYALIKNAIYGVSIKHQIILIAEGIGYRFKLNIDKNLEITAGFSHSIILPIYKDITILIESPTRLIISGISKDKVSFYASLIRKIRRPDPYKGRGFIFEGEKIKTKSGKLGKSSKTEKK